MKRSQLKGPTLTQVQTWDRRPRTPLPKIGRKKRREQAAEDANRVAVIGRSRGYCEGQIDGVCPAYPHGALHVHHVWPEDRDCGRHDPDRCFHLCVTAHDWVHANPRAAATLGLLRPWGSLNV